MTQPTPCKRCHGTGTEHPHGNRKIPWDEVLRLHEMGWTAKDLAARYKCTENAIRNILAKSQKK